MCSKTYPIQKSVPTLNAFQKQTAFSKQKKQSTQPYLRSYFPNKIELLENSKNCNLNKKSNIKILYLKYLLSILHCYKMQIHTSLTIYYQMQKQQRKCKLCFPKEWSKQRKSLASELSKLYKTVDKKDLKRSFLFKSGSGLERLVMFVEDRIQKNKKCSHKTLYEWFQKTSQVPIQFLSNYSDHFHFQLAKKSYELDLLTQMRSMKKAVLPIIKKMKNPAEKPQQSSNLQQLWQKKAKKQQAHQEVIDHPQVFQPVAFPLPPENYYNFQFNHPLQSLQTVGPYGYNQIPIVNNNHCMLMNYNSPFSGTFSQSSMFEQNYQNMNISSYFSQFPMSTVLLFPQNSNPSFEVNNCKREQGQ